jgi:hypothetical protein
MSERGSVVEDVSQAVTVAVVIGVIVRGREPFTQPVVLVTVEPEPAVVDRVVQTGEPVGMVVLDAEAEVPGAATEVAVVVHHDVVVQCGLDRGVRRGGRIVGEEHRACVALGDRHVLGQALVEPSADRLCRGQIGGVPCLVRRSDAEGMVVGSVFVVRIVPHRSMVS